MFSTTINAQKKSDPYKPKWVTHKLPESKSGTYIFISSYGEGTSLDAARQKALANLSSRLEIERGLKVSSVLSSKMKETFSSYEDDNDYTETTEIDMVVEEHGKELNIVCRVVDEYWEKERKGYKVYVLYTVADKNFHGGSYNDKITVTSKYGANGLLSIIPGAGQFYKGANFKGTAIITAEVFVPLRSALSRLFCSVLSLVRTRYVQKIDTTTPSAEISSGTAIALMSPKATTPSAEQEIIEPT